MRMLIYVPDDSQEDPVGPGSACQSHIPLQGALVLEAVLGMNSVLRQGGVFLVSQDLASE